MERLSVSESIFKRWTTLKTEVVGGLPNSRELKQYNRDFTCKSSILQPYNLYKNSLWHKNDSFTWTVFYARCVKNATLFIYAVRR